MVNTKTISHSARASVQFRQYEDVRKVLHLQSEAELIQGLTALRNHLTVKHSEGTVALNDERLLLVKSWLESDRGAQDLFDLWASVNTRQTSLLCIILSVFSSSLSLLAPHYSYHHLGLPIILTLLSPQWSSKLNAYLSTSQNDLLLATLKLYIGLSTFAEGKESKTVLDSFPWGLKSLPKLLGLRRRSNATNPNELLSRPDIRTLYILLLLSFVDKRTPTMVKAAFLEQRRDHFTALFRGISQDSYSVVRRILEICWVGIWQDVKLKRTTKIGIFNESTVGQIARLYERTVAEGDDTEEIPADLAHHFLLAVCTHPGVGICFRDQGWYPRIDSDDEGYQDPVVEPSQRFSGRIYNKILATVLKSLRVNEDIRQQELALRILQACPELVAGYWSTAALTLEPRLSSKWIANISFLGNVVSLPVPRASFLLDHDTKLYRTHPPALFNIVENIIPSTTMKIHLSRGLQSASALVQHCTAVTLGKCLNKFGNVTSIMREIQKALEEDDEDGLWSIRRKEVEREVLRRVPDFQVIVAFAQQKTPQVGGETHVTNEKADSIKSLLLAECAQRLLWLYHRHFSQLASEARFDLSKLLPGIAGHSSDETGSPGFTILRQLHTLRLLHESEEFPLLGRIGSSRGNLNILLTLYVNTSASAVQTTIRGILKRTLSSTLLFQHDVEEVDLWLYCLPCLVHLSDLQSSSQLALLGEAETIVACLEDCIQRCLKAPYRYLESLQTLFGQGSSDAQLNALPSPLLVTLVEQLEAKFTRDLLSPAECGAIAVFIRKLIVRLTSKCCPKFLSAVVARLDKMTTNAGPAIATPAIAHHINAVTICLSELHHPTRKPGEFNPMIEKLLEETRSSLLNGMQSSQRHTSSSTVNWLSLAQERMSDVQFLAFVDTVRQSDPSILEELLQRVLPGTGHVWNYVNHYPAIRHDLDPTLLFLHATAETLNKVRCRETLVDAAFERSHALIDLKRLLGVISYRLVVSETVSASRDLVLLVAELLRKIHDVQPIESQAVVVYLWQLSGIARFSRSSLCPTVLPAFEQLIEESWRVAQSSSECLLHNHAQYWSGKLKVEPIYLTHDEIQTAVIWMHAMSREHLLDLFDHLGQSSRPADHRILNGMCIGLLKAHSNGSSVPLAQRLPQLWALQSILPKSSALRELISIATTTSLPLFCDGRNIQTDTCRRISDLVASSFEQWNLSLVKHLEHDHTKSLLEQEHLTVHDASSIAAMMYRSRTTRISVLHTLLQGSTASPWSNDVLAILLYALVDTDSFLDELTDGERVTLIHVYDRMIAALDDAGISASTRRLYESSLYSLASLPAPLTELVFGALAKTRRGYVPASHLLSILGHIRMVGEDCRHSVIELLGEAMKYIVTTFSTGGPLHKETYNLMRSTGKVIKQRHTDQVQFAETVVATAIQYRLQDIAVLDYIALILESVPFKPAEVNRFLQSIMQHQHFYVAARALGPGRSSTRACLVNVLYYLFKLHPANSCLPSHAAPLLQIYGGSMSTDDRQLLSIFKLFESIKKLPTTSLVTQWSAVPDARCSDALDSILSFDPARMLRTCLQFPQRIIFGDDDLSFSDEQIYDPFFVIPLFSHMLVVRAPSSALSWVQLFRTNVVSLLLRTLSARSENLRDIALVALSGLHQILQDADMQEKMHVLYLLTVLKDAYPANPRTGHCPRLPVYATLHLAHALRGVFYPSNFTYPLTARFLLQRPQLDTDDMPLLYSMLYSVSDQWRKERAWIVRFMSDGMAGRQEWKILRRRHTWDLLASLFQSEPADLNLRRSILELLSNLTCERHAVSSLVIGSSLLSWLELQLEQTRPDESEACIKILENIFITVDLRKLEIGTNGNWRHVFVRCVLRFLRSPACNPSGFAHSVRLILRLSSLPSISSSQMDALICCGVRHLTALEDTVYVPNGAAQDGDKLEHHICARSPHRSHSLWNSTGTDDVALWGQCVEWLWSAAMTMQEKCTEWDHLTARLLIWRAMAGDSGGIAEWARKEVVRGLADNT